jgi:hypothetical protein
MSAKEYFDSDGKALDARFHITQDHLSDQDLRKLDVTSLNPLSPEVSVKNLQKMQRPNCILKQTSPPEEYRQRSMFVPTQTPPHHAKIKKKADDNLKET